MTIQEDLKKEAAKNKYVKWGILSCGVVLVIALFATGRKDDAAKLFTFVESLSEVSSTELVGEDVSNTSR